MTKLRPDLSGALFLTLRLLNVLLMDQDSFARAEKSGNGRRIKAPKNIAIGKVFVSEFFIDLL